MLEKVEGDEAASLFLDYSRIGPNRRGLPFLRDLAAAFSRIPYENISKIIKSSKVRGLPQVLRLPLEVVTEHIQMNFGGTCFSLTFLLERMLRSLGFEAYKVMAHMNSGSNVHCLVVVEEAGKRFLIDPGYALYEVIELPREGASRVICPHAVVEVLAQDGGYHLRTHNADGPKWRYVFSDRPLSDRDFETHWIASFGKPTLNNICLTRMTPRGHIYIRKDYFKFTSRKTIDKRRLGPTLEETIQEVFGIEGQWTEMAQRILSQRREGAWQK